MGMGMLASILVIVATLAMDIIVHEENRSIICMFSTDVLNFNFSSSAINTSSATGSFYYVMIIQQALYNLFSVITTASKYEFIFSQSPDTVMGLIIGLSFALQGIFQAAGAVLFLPFVFFWHYTSMPSCWTVYYNSTGLDMSFAMSGAMWRNITPNTARGIL